MNLLRILGSRIAAHIRGYTLVFLLFFLGVCACSFSFLYFYGNYVSYQTFVWENEDMFRRYELQPAEPGSQVFANDVETLLSKGYGDVTLHTSLPVDNLDALNGELPETFQLSLRAAKGAPGEFYSLWGRNFFTAEEKESLFRGIVAVRSY